MHWKVGKPSELPEEESARVERKLARRLADMEINLREICECGKAKGNFCLLILLETNIE